MKRYTFLLLAFFLTQGAAATIAPGTKETSARNVNELGNIRESTEQANQPTNNAQLNNINSNRVPNAGSGTKTSALNSVNCKTYEGKVFDQGEAGYNDCIRKIKNDRQGARTVP